MGDRHGCLCHLRRTFQAGLQRAQGYRSLHPGGRVSARLPAPPGGRAAVAELFAGEIPDAGHQVGPGVEPPYNTDVWQPPANPNVPAEEEVEGEATA